jgi:transcriptional regulator with XRE-family HTH domain
MTVSRAERTGDVDANAVVSYNVRAIRERRGWTHAQVAERLSRTTGRDVTAASVAAMERVGHGRPRRRFDAHELYVLSVVFDVPIVYFFLPPPEAELDGRLAGTDLPVSALYASFLGHSRQLDVVDERLRQVQIGDPSDTVGGLRAVLGHRGGPDAWQAQYYAWRACRLHQWGSDYGEQLDDIGHFLSFLGQAMREAVPEAHLSATADEAAQAAGRSGQRSAM